MALADGIAVDQRSLRVRLQRGVIWQFLAASFGQGSTFALNLIVANLLGRQLFGQYAIVQSTLLTWSTLAQLATGYTAAKYIAEFRSTDKARAGRILTLGAGVSAAIAVVVAAALFGLAPWLAREILANTGLVAPLRITAGALPFVVLNGFQSGALAGLEAYPALAIAGITGGVTYVGFSTALAWRGGLAGALAGILLSAVVQWAVLLRLLLRESARQGIRFDLRTAWKEQGIITRFTLPAALSGFSSMPALWLASTMLVRQPDGYSQMALYTAAYNLKMLVLFLPAVVNNVGMSLLNNQKGLGDTVRYYRLFWANLILTMAAVLLGAAGVGVLGPSLLSVFGRTFEEGYPILLLLLISTLPEALALAIYQIVQSHARLWLSLLTIALPRDLAIVALAYLLIPGRGAAGLAAAYAIAWFGALVLYIVVARTIAVQARAHPLKVVT